MLLILVFGIVHLCFQYARWAVSSRAYHPYSSLPHIYKTVKSYIFNINQYMHYYDYGNIIINLSHIKDESFSQHFIFLKLITHSLCFYLEPLLQLVTLRFSKQNVNIGYCVSFSYPKDMVLELWHLLLQSGLSTQAVISLHLTGNLLKSLPCGPLAFWSQDFSLLLYFLLWWSSFLMSYVSKFLRPCLL